MLDFVWRRHFYRLSDKLQVGLAELYYGSCDIKLWDQISAIHKRFQPLPTLEELFFLFVDWLPMKMLANKDPTQY